MTSTKDNLNNRIIPPDGGHDAEAEAA